MSVVRQNFTVVAACRPVFNSSVLQMAFSRFVMPICTRMKHALKLL